MTDQLSSWDYFSSTVYIIEKPEFLDEVKLVSDEYLQNKQPDDIYPVTMSDNYSHDTRLENFCSYVAQTAWNILDIQGYAMDDYNTLFQALWTQKHDKYSSMDYHTHGEGAQLVGFYILNSPENGSRLILHDPRISKIQSELPKKHSVEINSSTSMINFELKPGTLIFTNAWLPHSFTRNANDQESVEFVHFNIIAEKVIPQPVCAPADEII